MPIDHTHPHIFISQLHVYIRIAGDRKDNEASWNLQKAGWIPDFKFVEINDLKLMTPNKFTSLY